ncbi:tyrosine-type recombinase/integrase [Clostridium baratii]|uniref:tyrosine-type recombinase/integrase n=1 Tax=Clostridium baratii TaxID=1561 RepID=UPI0029433376|nr:tyrosine-type recombinase/integrase [Clostridium baratii]
MDYNITYREKNNGIQVIVSYKDDLGKWKQKSKQGFPNTREGKKKAKLAADTLLQEIKNNLENKINLDYCEITFKQFTNMYIEHIKLYRSLKTVIVYQSTIKAFKDLDNLKLKDINTFNIQKCIDKLTKKGLRETTIKDYITKLSTIFNTAINNYNIIAKSPVKNLNIKESKKKFEKKALTDKEFDELVRTFENSKYVNYVPVIIIAGTCGLRIGEIMGLTWEDVDFKSAVLTVNKQWKVVSLTPKRYGFDELKSKNSYRSVPIPPKTIAYLENLKQTQPANPLNRIIKSQSNDAVISFLNKKFKALGFNISIHELRHTYATKLIANGIDFKTAANLLGHTVEQTMKTYSHVTNDMLNRASNIINNIF